MTGGATATITRHEVQSHMLARAPWHRLEDGSIRYALEAPTFDRFCDLRAATAGEVPFITDAAVGHWLTWTDVVVERDRLAHGLMRRGVSRGDRVAVLAENRVDAVIVLLAAARLGAVGVPMNWRLTARELEPIFLDADPTVTVVEDRYASRVPELGRLLVVGDDPTDQGDLAELTADEGRLDAAMRPGPDDALFFLYTSGTTGTPKAAVLTHDNVMQNIQNFWRAMGTSVDDVALVAAPLFHVTGLMAQVAHMVQAGGRCVLQPHFSPAAFLEAAETYAATYTCAVPTVFRILLNHPDVSRRDLSAFRTSLFGGSAIPPDTMSSLREVWPQLRLVNTYGATESTGSSTFLPAELAEKHPLSVGYAVPNVTLDIVDQSGATVQDGTAGELVVRGPTVSPGYWRRPDATEFRWGGWVSGDVAVGNEDGLIELLDRKKDMINRGGEKIFTIELENVLHAHPAVSEAAVTAVPDDVYGEEALAVLVARAATNVDADTVRAYLREHLAEHKIPRYLVFVTALPKGGSGKIDKKALRAVAESALSTGGS